MEEKIFHVRLNDNGEFQRTSYVGGTTLLVGNIDVDKFSYTVLMEYVVDYIKITEIGGIYISKGKRGGWQLVLNDQDLAEPVKGCKHDEEINLYIDTTIDKEIEPIPQGKPHLLIRPRRNLIEVSAKKPVKPKFVTRHQLQQQCKKMNNKSPQVNKRKKSETPRLLFHGEQDEPMKEKGFA